ncbi:MAG: YafY family transcriptional regulator [Turicibacter sp.]|nr:YafY family transcriptional regulator [Turicibacter sp.]
MQSNRLFEILYILLNKQQATAKELAERFEVSTRTIYRDIDALSLTGVPVYTEKGKGGGIRLMPDFVMNKSVLNDREQQEVLSSLHGLSQLNVTQAGTTLEKLSATFNKTATDWLEVDFSGWYSDNTELFATLKTAILQRKIVAFDYLTPEGKTLFRQVEPTKLWFKSKAWYVKTFCLLRQSARTFKLNRIRNLTLTETSFLEREVPMEQVYDEQEESAEMVDFKLKFDPSVSYRMVDDFGSGTLQEDGSYLVDFSWWTDDWEWLMGTILSYGEHIEVLAPATMREAVYEKASKIREKYSRG